jgi:hypothetical protein
VAVYAEDGIFVFEPDGRWHATIGRAGGGPGEFRGPLILRRSNGDTMLVLDEGNRRASYFTSDGVLIRTTALNLSARDVAIGNDHGVVVNAMVRTPEAAGLPLHLVDPVDGSVNHAFGAVVPVLRADQPRTVDRVLAPARCSSACSRVWSALPTRYEIELWDYRSGEFQYALRRRPPWFSPHWQPEVVVPTPDHAPPPYITGMGTDACGRLWVYSLAADPEWREALGPQQERGGRAFYPVLDVNRYYDTVFEVLDGERGQLVASGRIDQALPLVVDHGRVAALDVGHLDTMYSMEVWQVTLHTPTGGC